MRTLGAGAEGPSQWRGVRNVLAHLGVRYLQIGGDWWNRCNEGWLNIDSAFQAEGLRNYQIGTDDKGAHNMVVIFDSKTVLPFASQSVQLIYSEHMLEHMLPDKGGANWIRELVRLLVVRVLHLQLRAQVAEQLGAVLEPHQVSAGQAAGPAT